MKKNCVIIKNLKEFFYESFLFQERIVIFIQLGDLKLNLKVSVWFN